MCWVWCKSQNNLSAHKDGFAALWLALFAASVSFLLDFTPHANFVLGLEGC